MNLNSAFEEAIGQLEAEGKHEEAAEMRAQIDWLKETQPMQEDKKTTDIEGWSDVAMFEAEDHSSWDADKGVQPVVTLLHMSTDPLGAIAALSEMYKGHVVRSRNDLNDDIRKSALEDVQKTHLKAPLEAVKVHFMIEGVDRGFTHQMVRQRTAVYAQESLRFAVIGDLLHATTLPPILQGTKQDDPMRVIWEGAINDIDRAYHQLVSAGMPQEDARGLLPHAVATRLNYVTDLRNLSDHSGNRLCTQAQFHWRSVFNQIVQQIRNFQHRPEVLVEDRWQFDALCNTLLFAPVCYQLGHCPFEASFDRHCTIRDRVQLRASVGSPSSEWAIPDIDRGLDAINPAEWLLDPTSARTV